MEALAIGNLVKDPEFERLGPKNRARVRFTVAVDDRYRDAQGKWTKGTTLFFMCEAWDELAELIGSELSAGEAVIAVGRWRAATWPSDEGTRRRQWIAVEEIGPRLRPPKAAPIADEPTPGSDSRWDVAQ